MDEQGFRTYLKGRNLEPDAIDRSVDVVRWFERELEAGTAARGLAGATTDDVHRFAATLIARGDNTEEKVLALARYARFSGNGEASVAWLELFDGWDVPANLARKLGDLAGNEARDDVFAGLTVPPLGTPAGEKPAFTRGLMDRLSAQVDPETCRRALTSGLHFVPKEAFAEERERYLAAPDVDAFIADEHDRYIAYLAGLRDSGELYFSQPITEAVVEYVRVTPTCGPGVRVGPVVRVTKIPYMADRYLQEDDETRKRYLACHCMWARESLLNPEVRVPPLLCQCSAGFEKQYWDAVLDQPVEVDVVRSALQGDPVCEFAVHLPEVVVPADG
jgi:hypothetical protein